MADQPEKDGAAQAGTRMSEALAQFVNAMGLIYSDGSVYGHEHSVTQAVVQSAFGLLTQALEEVSSIDFTVVEHELMVNRKPVLTATPAIHALIDQLMKIEVPSFSFKKGMTQEELNSVMEILHATPEEMSGAGGFGKVVEALSLSHVSARKVVFKRIDEDDLVVSKKKLKEELGTDNVDDVVSFLTGDGDSAVASGGLGALATDPSKLAETVLTAAGVGKGQVDADGGDRIQECVKRLYDALVASPKTRTQKGKKDLIKNLDKLKKELQQAVRERSGDDAEAVEQGIVEEIDGMMDELMIDTLADEYAKKQKAVDKSEMRILRYMKRLEKQGGGGESLKGRLMSGGLSEDAWEELLEESSEMAADEGAADEREQRSTQTAEALLTSLAKLENILGGGEGSADQAGSSGSGLGAGQGPGLGDGLGPGQGGGDGTGIGQGPGRGPGNGIGLGPGLGAGEGPGEGGGRGASGQRSWQEDGGVVFVEETDGGTGDGSGQGSGAGTGPGVGTNDEDNGGLDANIGLVVQEIAQRVDALAEEAESKIEAFLKKARGRRKKGKNSRGPTRRAIIEFLGEMVQELRQPLAVITGAVDAMKGGMLGDTTDAQHEMLILAAEGASRLDHLTDKLLEVSGLPSELTPDSKILDSVYDGNKPHAVGDK